MNSGHLLSVVIPAYNEQDAIVAIVERVLATCPALEAARVETEVLVVDDGSQDRTAQLASQHGVRVIRHLKNRGYGAALKTGFHHARGDYLAFLDADGTYPPEALPTLCRALQDQSADLVVGSRMSGASSAMPATRKLGNLAFARLLSLISGVQVRDSASGMRVIRRTVLPLLYPLPDGLDFTPAMTTRAIHEDLKIVEVPIAYAERVGRSKLSVVRDGVRFTNTIVWMALSYNPVRILGVIGSVMLTLALVLGVVLGVAWLSGSVQLDGATAFGAFAILVLGVTGSSLIWLGVMFSYLIALFTKKPVRRGMFGRVIFDPPLDYAFGRIGAGLCIAGVVFGAGATVLGIIGWEFVQLWLLLLAAALLLVVGIQLILAWIVIRVLDELARREASAERDLKPAPSMVEATGGLEATSNIR